MILKIKDFKFFLKKKNLNEREKLKFQKGEVMKKYLLNSAMMPTGCYGFYHYQPADEETLREFLEEGDYQSFIGYEETARFIESVTGIKPPKNRLVCRLEPPAEIMVVRLKYRINPNDKGKTLEPSKEDWEISKIFYYGKEVEPSCLTTASWNSKS